MEETVYYKALFDNNPDCVFCLDREGTIEDINKGAERIFGYVREDTLGVHFSKFLKTALREEAGQAFQKVLNGEATSFHSKAFARDGTMLSIHVTLFPAIVNGEVRKVQGVIQDHTEVFKAADALKQQADDLFRQNQDLQQFTYIVSHNLRAPMANIVGCAGILKKIKKDDPVFDEFLEKMTFSAYQLDQVIKDINAILSLRDKQKIGEKEVIHLLEVINQVKGSFKNLLDDISGQFLVEIAPDCRIVSAKAYIYSILHNLILNAIKYRAAERALQVSVRAYYSLAGELMIEISDNGIGMDMQVVGDNLFKLYKRFNTTVEGRGLGLFLVKTQVEALSGQIEVTSDLGKGTTFKIKFKAYDSEGIHN
jgi:PAS domain S-box-containing protein